MSGYFNWQAELERLRAENARLRTAGQKLRDAGGRLYPGSPPGMASNLAAYREACATLGTDPDAWSEWLDALDAWGRTNA